MPALLLVRHGQALDPLQGGYDGLSDLGREQSERLGAALARLNVARTYVGPRARHALTAKLAWPHDAAPLAGLDEHAGHAVVEHLVAHPEAANAEVRAALEAAEREPSRAGMARVVAAVVRGWAIGEIVAPVDESFDAFRARVGTALVQLADGLEGSQVAVAFTSGGFIGAAVGHALRLSADATIELGVQVDNASLTELRFSRREPGRLLLKRFNGIAHLEPELVSGL